MSLRGVAAAGIAVATALSGCTTGGGGQDVDDREQQEAELAQRPSAEQEVARLTRVRDEIAARLGTELDLRDWLDRGNANAAGCADFPDSRGRTDFVSSLGRTGGVPDELWPRAAALVEAVAAEHGFGAAEVVVDRPGEHEIVLRGERGALLRFGTLANATLALESGCHLPEADRSG